MSSSSRGVGFRAGLSRVRHIFDSTNLTKQVQIYVRVWLVCESSLYKRVIIS